MKTVGIILASLFLLAGCGESGGGPDSWGYDADVLDDDANCVQVEKWWSEDGKDYTQAMGVYCKEKLP